MGTVLSIHISSRRGIEKTTIAEAVAVVSWGLEHDAHGGNWDRQVSIFPAEAMECVPKEKLEEVASGGYTENITISGVSLEKLKANSTVQIGDNVLIQIRHIGKAEPEEHGRPYIVSRQGRFGVILKGGIIRAGDAVKLVEMTHV